MEKRTPLSKDVLKVPDQPRRTVDEVSVGPPCVEKCADIDGRAREITKLTARLETDTKSRANIDNSLTQADGCAEIASGRVGELYGDAPEGTDATGQDLAVEGLGGVAGEANGVLDVESIAVGCV